jgi:hypothetical protein
MKIVEIVHGRCRPLAEERLAHISPDRQTAKRGGSVD